MFRIMPLKAKKFRSILSFSIVFTMIMTMVICGTPKIAKAAGSPLLSLRKPVLASSTEGSNSTDKAVDGNINSRWASVWQMDPQWIYVDLGSTANINRVYLSWEGAYAKSFQIQTSSDANTWTSIYSTTSGTGGVNDLTLSGTGRYVRVYCTQRALSDYGYSLYEFQVYGDYTTPQPPAPVNVALNKPTNASTWEVPSWSTAPDIVSARKVNDGDVTSRWSSESWDPQWVSIDLGTVHTIGTIVLSWESAYGKSYDIQVSDDNTNWKTVYRQLYGQGGVETIKVKASGRYVRMYGFARGTAFGYSLYEFEIYDFVNGDPTPAVHIPDMPVSKVVSVGAGSYKTNDITCYSPIYPEYKTANLKTPIPSGGWWQSILIKRLSDGIVPLPFRTQYTDQGLSIMNPGAGFVSSDGKTISTAGAPDFYLMASNIDPMKMSAKVDGYGDYSVRSVLSDDDTFKLKTTMVKGSPYLYNEFTDANSPFITLNASTRFFDDKNNPILASDGATVTADHLGVEVTNVDCNNSTKIRAYGIFAPNGTVFKKTGSKLTIQLGNGENYLSIATLPSNANLNYYYQHAYAFVTDTKATFKCDDATGMVTTTYNSTTQLKRSGFSSDTLLALLPNQWKSITSATTLTSYTYPYIRGTMKVHEGNSFFMQDKFTGIIPQFGIPSDSSTYNKADVISYLNNTNSMLENNYMWDDPYWEGKNLQPLSQAILIADQLGETAIRDKSLSILKKILTNWLTYSGGYPNDYPYYLYYSPEWGTMLGDGGDHGMAKWMSDHHYVWGYFIYASAILASYDKDYLNDYGGMVEELIKDIGNPSRNDSMYPYVRAFDPYEGVSWAGGYGDSYDGNNQEATSEALFAYAGEYLWGVLTNNAQYRDAGMWVYTVETKSVLDYWFDYDQDSFPANYTHGVAGQVWGSKNVYGTYFSTDPNCIYGIGWLPVAPYMSYFGLNSAAAKRTYDSFVKDKGGAENGWYHVIWPFEALSDPTATIAKWDPSKIAADDANGQKEWPNTYWFIHAMDAFGTRTSDIWSSNWTTYQAFVKNGKYTVNIWNPTSTTQYVVFRDTTGNIVGTVTVPSMKTVVADPKNGIQPPAANGQVSAPTFSVASGTYSSAQLVEISSQTPGATIRYTTDGTEPNASSQKYTGAINVSQNTTLKAKGFKELMNDSNSTSVNYVISVKDKVSIPAITPTTGTYVTSQTVTITDNTSGATIRYTTDGSTPSSTNGTVYSAPITISSTTTIKAIAYKSGMTDSDISTSTITITTSPTNTNLALNKTATAYSILGGNTASAAFDGNINTRWESQYSDPQWISIDLGSSYNLTGAKLNWETAAGKDYKIQVSNDNTNWADAYIKTGGTGGIENITFSTPYTGRYVRMYGTARTTGYGYSLWEFEAYGTAINSTKLSTPVITPATGTYSTSQTVNISNSTSGSSIRYTTDGSTPSATNGTIYTGAFTVSKTTTVKAIAYKSGMTDSDIASSIITINAQPTSLKIQAESYTAMSDIGTEACNDIDGGQNVGWIDTGDWMDYTINIPSTGSYNLNYRVNGWNTGAQIQLKLGNTILATTGVNTNNTWTTINSSPVTLTAGTQTLRVYASGGGFNLNWFELTK
ncbi:discoidin domain-containing protein [Clostridium sp. YIM B02505]|uniref:glucan endo-1,3-beta-D-glucosidase n=1 Tax=Clostridium yunnanense TaxID=2800325 RepID=A0ABS1EK01_9CLOT|nr:discoidin domain-containing protein [Clostridium yunnanense]MBK1809690.1 discoidin domain-containing protein [Clostridium yunnanense]